MVKILLVDDHTLVRRGLSMLVHMSNEYIVVGECENGEEVLPAVFKYEPDLILLDLSMPNGINGFQVIHQVREQFPELKIIILTMYDEEDYIKEAIECGANGYILKNGDKDILFDAISTVMSGKPFYRTAITERKIREWTNSMHSRNISILSDREKEILRLEVLGYSNRDMGDKLMISAKTVENHKVRIKQKLGITERHQLVEYAIKNGYLDLTR